MRKLCGDLAEEVQETMVEHTSAFRVRPGALASVAGLVIVPVVLAHILTFYLHRAFGTELTKDLKYFFYLDQERNLPTVKRPVIAVVFDLPGEIELQIGVLVGERRETMQTQSRPCPLDQ